VAECILETAKPIVFDPISELDQTGRFVIVDQYEISGGGIIVEEFSEELNKDIAKDSKHQSKLVLVTSGQGDHEQIISKEMEKVCEALRTQEIIQDYYII
jgi:sulfate adenylyltransferase subunit 1 (EFTu-like GTPase family)